MDFVALPFTDDKIGGLFSAWLNEFMYAMGAEFDFAKRIIPSKRKLVIALVCLPPHLADFGKSNSPISRKREELWSIIHLDYEPFISREPEEIIASLTAGFCSGFDQFPIRDVPDCEKAAFRLAAEEAAARLLCEPSRYPR